MQKIVWTDSVKNEEVLQSVNEKRNILYKKKKYGSLDWSRIALALPSKTRY